MKMWKMLGTAAALITTAVVATGCGGSSNSSSNGKVTISFMHWGGTETWNGCYKERVAQFEKDNPNIKVKPVTIGGGDNYDTKLQTMIAGNKEPDIVQVAENGTGFASKNAFASLNSRIKKDDMKLTERFGDVTAMYKWKGQTFAIPDRGGSCILYYNKDIFDKAGLKYPDGTWTTEKFYQTAKQLTKDTNGDGKTDQWGVNYTDWPGAWGTMVLSNGGNIMKDGKVTINSPQNIATFNEYYKNFKTSSVPYEVSEDGVNRFRDGKVAMSIDGMWWMARYADTKNLNFDIATVPAKSSWSTGSALTISKQSDKAHQDAAWKLIKYMSSDKGQEILGKTFYDVPASKKILASNSFQTNKLSGKTYSLKYIDEAQSKVKIDGLLMGPWYLEALTETKAQVKEMLLGHLTAKQMVKETQKKLEDIVAKYDD